MSHSLSWLWQHGEAPTLGVESRPLNDQTELVQFIKSSLVEDYVAALKAHVAHLGGTLDLVRRVDQLATVSVVGQGFKQSPELIEKALSSLAKGPLLCDVSNTVLCLGIMEADLQTTVKALHEAVIEQV
jgi:aspartokinase